MSAKLKEKILEALKDVYDPEIPINIVDLGLVYDIDVSGDGRVTIKMTLTSPVCPIAYFITDMVRETILSKIPEIKDVDVQLVFDPPWTPERMSPIARKLLGL